MTTACRGAIAALAAAALLAGGCGTGPAATTADLSCTELRAGAGLFRKQATLIVDREHVQVRSGSTGQAILGVELHLRHACRGARGDYRPYRDTVAAAPAGFIQPP